MTQQTSIKQILFGRTQRYIWLCLFFVALLLLSTFFNSSKTATAAASTTMNFQARLLQSSGALVADGNYNVEFKLYDVSTGGAPLWTETYQQANRVRVVNGYLTVNLGALQAFPNINWDQELWLTMNVGGTHATTPIWDGEMTPRLKLTAVPHAFTASKLQQTNGGNSSTLGFATQTASRNILLPDESGTVCLQGSGNCGFVTGSSADFIQNSTSPQAGNFNISGNGTIGGTLNVPTIDRATAGTLNIGTTTATTVTIGRISGTVNVAGGNINLQGNTAISAGNTLTVSSGELVITGRNSGSNTTLRVNNHTSTGNIFVAQDAATDVFVIADGGSVTSKTNSTTAFQIQNAGATNSLFIADTINTRIGIGATPANSLLTIGTNTTDAAGGITFGTDTNLYRSAADTLKTDDTFDAAAFSVGGTAGISATCAAGQVLQNQVVVGGIVIGGTCTTVSSASSALQGAYDDGNTILTQDARDISFTLANTTTDSNFIINVEDGSTSKFAIQNDGNDTFSVDANGNVLSKATTNSTNAFQVQNAAGASILNISTAHNGGSGAIQIAEGAYLDLSSGNSEAWLMYEANYLELGVDGNYGVWADQFSFGKFDGSETFLTINEFGDTVFRSATGEDYEHAFQIQNSSGGVLFNADTDNMRIGIGTDTPEVELHIMGQGASGSGARLALGDYDVDGEQNVFIGEYGSSDSDVMQIQGRNGIALTTGSNAEHINLEIDSIGAAYFQNTVDSTTGFGIYSADDTEFFRVDTLNGDVHIGTRLLNVDTDEDYVISNGTASVANEIPNSSFESDITSVSGRSGYESGSGNIDTSGNNARTGYHAMRVPAAGTFVGAGVTKVFDVTEGEQLYFRGWVKTSSGTNGEGGFYLVCYDRDWDNPTWHNSDWTNPGTSWALRSITLTVPAGCAKMTISMTVRDNSTTGNWYFDDLYLARSSFEGPALFKSSDNSTEAFQVQNATGQDLLTADTTNMEVTVGGWLAVNGISNPGTPTLTRTSGGSLTNSTTYYYKLSAVDSSGTETSAVTPSPASITTNSSNRTARLTWSAVPGAVKYMLYRSTNSGTTWNVKDIGNVTSINDNTNTGWGTVGSPQWWSETAGLAIGRDNRLFLSHSDEVFMGYSSFDETLAITNYVDNAQIVLQADNFAFTDRIGNSYLDIEEGGRATFRNSTNSTTAFQVQRSNGNNVLTADTTNNRVLIGSAANPTLSSAQLAVTVAEIQTSLRVGNATDGISFNDTATGESGKLRLYGSARNTKKITLTPEYAGAVLDGTGIGSMTAGVDRDRGESYYKWTSTQSSLQYYSIVITMAVPSDWSEWAPGTAAMSINTWRPDGGGQGEIWVVDGNLDVDVHEEIDGTHGVWETYNFDLSSANYTADGKMIIEIEMGAEDGSSFQVGDITLNYLSKF